MEYYLGLPRYIINIEPTQGDDGYRWLRITFPRLVWDRAAIIKAIIRVYYSADDVEAIMSNVYNAPNDETRAYEYRSFQQWRVKAKMYADELLAYATEHGMEPDWYQEPDRERFNGVRDPSPDWLEQMIQAVSLAKIQAADLPDEQALEVPALFPTWESYMGKPVAVDMRLLYAGKLWKVLQAHTVQADWTPDTVPALFTEVAADQEQGSIDNPIPYNGNMALEEGKYYTQGGVVYLCIRDTVNPVYNDLSALVGLYVQIVE